MKKLLPLFIAFAGLNIPAITAQNWAPLHLGYIYNYIVNEDVTHPYSIRIDGASLLNGDTVYSTNAVYANCATCYKEKFQYVMDHFQTQSIDFYLKNQAVFLGKTMTASGPDFIFNTPVNFTIKPFAKINDSWIYDKNNSISAEVADAYVKNVFGSNDSLKTILLSTGDTIILSKNNGIIQFPDNKGSVKIIYKLAGINGKNAGMHIPEQADFYSYNVGDIFEYHNKSDAIQGTWDYFEQYKIIAKTEDGKGGYTYIACGKDSKGGSLKGQWQPKHDLTPDRIPYFYPVMINARVFGDWSFNKALNAMQYKEDLTCDLLESISVNSDTVFAKRAGICEGGTVRSIAPGLGETAIYSDGLSGTYSIVLTAFKKGSIVSGTFTLDTASLCNTGIDNRFFSNNIRVYPNPCAGGEIHLHYDIENTAPVSLKITDMQGRILYSENMDTVTGNAQEHIIRHYLSDGMYLLQWQSSEGIQVMRLMVKN